MLMLLTSAGTEIKEEILKILPDKPNNLNLAHIITASKIEKSINYLIKERKDLKEMGFRVEEIDLEGKNEDQLRNLLKDKDIIYVQGGNTFFLLKQVRLSGFDKVVKDLINKGKIYIGVSAGSYIACPTIEQSTWKHQDRNRVGLTDLTALNLIPFLISAHFKEEYRPIIENAAKITKYPIVALYDTQAIVVKDNKWKLVGKGNKEFYNNFRETL